ncbi:MAG TPA: DHA2 family efflux MFS transporter permease subunit [Acetobacteraceae bacterium]|nr:DHA2 family efflux MFS transporter permease subunit [Acetobacteraceae bacterium]
MSPAPHDQVPHRLIITLCTVGATLMQALDQTIANVALPYMQGSLSASFDEITWVLTSYITAAAIMTAPVGWMAARFGRKYLFIGCLTGFTITSMLCGAAQSLNEMVMFRLLQGMFGAALVPLSQATMLDIYPPEQRGSAMAIWGVGVMIGPILGPTLGGYLTEMYNWRFVFYINLPFGVLATLGLVFFMPRAEPRAGMRFDWVGFAVLSLGIGGIQMMLDRGQDQDWFSSREIIIEAVLGCLGVYLFVVHMLTARRPFIPPALFTDRNFATGVGMMFAAGTILVSSSSLMAPWLQNLANYPVETAGLIMAPRGIGTMFAMVLAGRVATRVDPRMAMGFGILCVVWSVWEMTTWTPDIDEARLIFTITVQGFGLGFLFIPLQMVAFATLPVMLRTDGAGLFSLARNIGAAIGVSVTSSMLARHTQVLHSEIGSSVNPFNRALQDGGSVQQYLDPTTRHGAVMLDHMVNHQAQIIAYVNDYKMMVFTTLPALLLLFLMRRPRKAAPTAEASAAMD